MRTAERPRPRAAGSSETRSARRRAVQARRHRTMLVGATLVAAVVLSAWFPASDLLHQHEQLADATSALHRLDQSNHVLKKRATELETPAAIGRIAQQQYDLVSPGEAPYQVLPPSGADNSSVSDTTTSGVATSSSTGTTGAGSAGSAGGSGATTGVTAGAVVRTTSSGFFPRVLQTLEFWR